MSTFFQIAKDSGDIVLNRKLSPNLKYDLNITVRDENDMETITNVMISVKDINDHKPRFGHQEYAFNITEGKTGKPEQGIFYSSVIIVITV